MKKVLLSFLVGAFAFTLVGVGVVAAEDLANPDNNAPAWGQHKMKRGQFMKNRPELSEEEIAARKEQKLQHGAEMLGISVDELKAKIESGMKFREIAEEAGITKEDMQAKMKEHAKIRMTERLNQLVADGEITQEQADKRLEQMQQLIEDGKRPGKGHKGFFKGPRPNKEVQ